MKITVKSLGDLIGIEFQLPDGQTATVELPQEDAQHVSLALIGHASSEDMNSKSLFEGSPALSTWNPPLELSISDKGQLLIAYRARNFRPFLVQLEKERALELLAALKNLLAD